MNQIIPITKEQQRKLYNTCSKDHLIEMIIECNRILYLLQDAEPSPSKFTTTIDNNFWELS